MKNIVTGHAGILHTYKRITNKKYHSICTGIENIRLNMRGIVSI